MGRRRLTYLLLWLQKCHYRSIPIFYTAYTRRPMIAGGIVVLNPLERSPDARNYYHSSSPPSPTTPCHERHDFMGTWFVVGVKPTLLETTCSNAVEIYTRRRRRQKKNDKSNNNNMTLILISDTTNAQHPTLHCSHYPKRVGFRATTRKIPHSGPCLPFGPSKCRI